MATRRQRKSVKGVKSLPAKKLASKEASRVKAGYIGDTEKNYRSSINRGDASKR